MFEYGRELQGGALACETATVACEYVPGIKSYTQQCFNTAHLKLVKSASKSSPVGASFEALTFVALCTRKGTHNSSWTVGAQSIIFPCLADAPKRTGRWEIIVFGRTR